MQKMSSHEAGYPWTWVSRLSSKCIYQGAKMHEVSSRDVSFVFVLDLWPWPRIWSFRMTFELRPWIKSITFSGRHKGENVFTWCYVPLKHGFHESEKSHFQASKMQKMSSHEARYPWKWVWRLGSKYIFRGPNCTKWDLAMCHSCLTLAANLVFSHDHELKLTFSGRHKGENVFTWSYELL